MKLSWNYVLTTYKSCFIDQVGTYHAYQSHAKLYNQPSFIFHTKNHTKLIILNPWTNSIHAHHSFHAFNILIHPNMWQTYKDRGENRTNTHSRPTPRSGRKVSLRREGAQASSFRLSESSKRGTMASCDLSLRRALLAWARL